MGQTFAQKVLARAAGLDKVAVSQIVTVKPAHLLTHDNTAAIVGKIGDDLAQYGVVNPDLSVIVLDHVTPAANEKTATGHKNIREFVAKHGLKNFCDIGEGICYKNCTVTTDCAPRTPAYDCLDWDSDMVFIRKSKDMLS